MDNIDSLRQSVSAFAASLDLPPFVHTLNALLDRQAWAQAAVEEQRAMQKIADMWAIVQEVATEKSTYWHDNYACQECPFCHGVEDFKQSDAVMHESTCIVTKARTMIEKPEQGA